MKDAVLNTQPQFMKAVLQVKKQEFITPKYIRITLEGKEISRFKEARVGDNNKILIPHNKSQKLNLPDGSQGLKAEKKDFSVRTYTLKALDIVANEMVIDFVMHGDAGPASAWAIHAQPGDELGVLMKTKTKPLFKPAKTYFIVGDHTALPVISVLLEQLPETAKGYAIIEVFDASDIQELKKPEGVLVLWKFNKLPGENSYLAGALKALPLKVSEDLFVYAAAEYKTIKTIQEYLKSTGLDRSKWYAYSYWKHGVAEDASAADRRALQS